MEINKLNLNCIEAIRNYNKSKNIHDLSIALKLNSQLGFMKKMKIKNTNNFKDKELLKMRGLK